MNPFIKKRVYPTKKIFLKFWKHMKTLFLTIILASAIIWESPAQNTYRDTYHDTMSRYKSIQDGVSVRETYIYTIRPYRPSKYSKLLPMDQTPKKPKTWRKFILSIKTPSTYKPINKK